MGDDQSGLVLRHTLQLGLDGALVSGIQRAGGFVKNQDGRVFEQRTGNRPLFFAA